MSAFRKQGSRRIVVVTVAVALAVAALFTGCVQTGVDTYDEFRSAVDSGASCEQLIDIRRSLDDSAVRNRADEDLKELGCDSPGSTRSDAQDDSE